jgi:hypothetical protein
VSQSRGSFPIIDRLEEFYILFGYLFRYPNISVPPENETADWNAESIELKTSLTNAENEKIEKLYADDIWFFDQAKQEYERRIEDPRVEAIFRDAASPVHEAVMMLQKIGALSDPAVPTRRAFSLEVGEKESGRRR